MIPYALALVIAVPIIFACAVAVGRRLRVPTRATSARDNQIASALAPMGREADAIDFDWPR